MSRSHVACSHNFVKFGSHSKNNETYDRNASLANFGFAH